MLLGCVSILFHVIMSSYALCFIFPSLVPRLLISHDMPPFYFHALYLLYLLSFSTSSSSSPLPYSIPTLLFYALILLSFSVPYFSSPIPCSLPLSHPDVNRSADCDVFMHKNVSFGIMCVDPVRSLGKYMSADFTVKLNEFHDRNKLKFLHVFLFALPLTITANDLQSLSFSFSFVSFHFLFPFLTSG